MELISRILDGSIPESLRASLPPSRMFGPRVTQDDKIARLEEVALLEECSHKQLKAVAKITEVVEVPAETAPTVKLTIGVCVGSTESVVSWAV